MKTLSEGFVKKENVLMLLSYEKEFLMACKDVFKEKNGESFKLRELLIDRLYDSVSKMS